MARGFHNAPQPGLGIAQGLAAGFGAVGAGLQTANMANALAEYDANYGIREAERAKNLDMAQTLQALGRTSNAALQALDANRAALYNDPTGYMQAMNAMTPLAQGSTRKLSADGKTIETVNALGQVIDTTPNLRGQAAENALINRGGINLFNRASELPKQEQYAAGLQAQLAMAKAETDMRMAALAAGGRGGLGGLGGGHGGSNKDPLKFGLQDLDKMAGNMVARDARFAHLIDPLTGKMRDGAMPTDADYANMHQAYDLARSSVLPLIMGGMTNEADLFVNGLARYNTALGRVKAPGLPTGPMAPNHAPFVAPPAAPAPAPGVGSRGAVAPAGTPLWQPTYPLQNLGFPSLPGTYSPEALDILTRMGQ